MNQRAAKILSEMWRRVRDPLDLYEPLPTQQKFFECESSIRVIRGGNRSGKSMTSFVEFARAVQGKDPHNKFPKDRPILAYIVGYDEDTIGRVAYRLLFKPGAYQLIEDPVTGKVRAFRPWEKWDKENKKKAFPAPPLINHECIEPKSMGWSNAREKVFSICRLNFGEGHPMNGTEIRAFGSRSEPAMGDPVDLVLIDEDIFDERWATEMQARLSDREGKMIWSAFPMMHNDALKRMSTLAEEQKDQENPTVSEFVLRFSDNPHMSDKAKTERYAVWTEEERRARDFGEYVLDSILMYPSFNPHIHGWTGREGDWLNKYVSPTGELPDDWTRYMVVDPGHTVCAVLYAAVPPPEVGDYIVVEDESYIRKSSASIFADEVKQKVGNRGYEAFIIDDHGGRVTQAGSGLTIKFQYSQELHARGIRSKQSQSGFLRGSDDVEGRAMQVRSILESRDKPPKFRYLANKVAYLPKEIENYRKRLAFNKGITDKPVAIHNHACNCLEYLAAFNPYYAPAPADPQKKSAAFEAFLEMSKKPKGEEAVNLGPIASYI